MCAIITKPSLCAGTKYDVSGSTIDWSGSLCPIEVDCGGVKGKYVRVRLPGQNRVLAVANVDVFRSEPISTPSASTVAGDAARAYACYGLESKPYPVPTSANFLNDLKIMDYEFASDVGDPVFYSTCYVYEEIKTFLPLPGDAVTALVAPQWNYTKWSPTCISIFVSSS